MSADWRERIKSNPNIHHGDPCVVGTRVPVSVIVGSIADDDGPDGILKSYPQLTADDIATVLRFAAEAVNRLDCSCSNHLI